MYPCHLLFHRNVTDIALVYMNVSRRFFIRSLSLLSIAFQWNGISYVIAVQSYPNKGVDLLS